MKIWSESLFRSSRPAVKKVFLKISQNLKENICARVSFLIKLQASGLRLFIKKEALVQVFPLNLRNF